MLYVYIDIPICNLNVLVDKMNSCLKMKMKVEEEMSFMKSGRLLLEELNAFCNVKSNPILVLSAEEFKRATNNYDKHQCILWDGEFKLYKDSLKEHMLSVKKYFTEEKRFSVMENITLGIIKDIVVGSQMSVHQNVLQLLGCCLETKYIDPTETIHFEPLAWKCRLRIAMGIANAVANLHTAFSRPIIHRDVRSAITILVENKVAKLIDFSRSISIPKGEHVEDVVRSRLVYLASEYAPIGYITEKVDVYIYGVLLLGLLAGWMLNTP